MSGWRETTLGDLIDIYDSVRVPLSAAQRATRKGSFPYYGAQGIIDFVDAYLFDGRYILVPEDGENLNSRKLPIAYFAEGKFWVNNHAHIIRAKPDKADDVFLKHAINALDISGYVTGAAQPKLTQANLRRIGVLAPDLDTQRRIGSILGAYDDLIEVNRRRVAVLEDMARGLFEEWFVRLRFPGHEGAVLHNTPDGPLPEGWRRGCLRDVAALKSGFAFKSGTFVVEGLYSLVTIKHVHDGALVPPFLSRVEALPPKMPGHCLIAQGDMLLSLTGNVGRVCLAWGENLVLNQRVAKVVPNAASMRAFVYRWFRQPMTLRLLQQISNGVAQQNLSPVQAMELPVLLPADELMATFEAVAGPMMDLALQSAVTIANLQNQRDLLLPRLMSGQLSIAEAEAKAQKELEIA